jgi:hypothetical protein
MEDITRRAQYRLDYATMKQSGGEQCQSTDKWSPATDHLDASETSPAAGVAVTTALSHLCITLTRIIAIAVLVIGAPAAEQPLLSYARSLVASRFFFF